MMQIDIKMIEKNLTKIIASIYNATKLFFGLQEQDSQSKRRLSKKIQILCQNDFAPIVTQPTSRQGSVLTNRETGMKTQ